MAVAVATAVLLVATGCTVDRGDDSDPAAPAGAGDQAGGSGPAPDPVPVPDTPAGEALDWVLGSIGEAPDDDELAERFAPEFLAALPPDEVRRILAELPAVPPPFATGYRVDSSDRVLAEVHLGDGPWLIDVEVSESDPHPVVALWFGPGGPASEGEVDIPETPAGEALGWLLDALGRELDDDELDRWIAPSLFEEVGRDDFADQTAGMRREPPPVVRSLRVDEDTVLVARVTVAGLDQLIVVVTEDDEPHRITGARLLPALPEPVLPTALDEVEDAWVSLAPEAPLLVADVVNGRCEPVVESEPDLLTPVASAFKLYVLAAVAEAIANGDLAWDDPLPISDELKSLPSGTFQDLDEGTVRTVEEHAQAMIAMSDNTATDHLIDLVGHEAVEDAFERLGHSVPEVNQPLLTTRQAFQLLGLATDDERSAWAGTDPDARAEVLDGLADRPLPSLSEMPLFAAHTSTVGWFASPTDLCEALVVLEELSRWPGLEPLGSILAAPDGLVEVPNGGFAWFKGGDMPGVANGTLLVSDGTSMVAAIGSLTHPQLIGIDQPERVLSEAALLALATE